MTAALVILAAALACILIGCWWSAWPDIQRAIDAHRAHTEAERVADRIARDADHADTFRGWRE